MSSTNRWKTYRAEFDYYVTPQHHIRNFLTRFMEQHERSHEDLQKMWILDPCAWWDKNHDMSYPAILFEQWADDKKLLTLDIREDSGSKYKWDFLEPVNTWIDREDWHSLWVAQEFDLVITNPPFAIAQSIIERSLELCKDWGYVVMLLRLNYFGSKGRKQFRENNMPISCYVHHERMSFSDNGATDSIEYIHAVRKKWDNPKYSKLYII